MILPIIFKKELTLGAIHKLRWQHFYDFDVPPPSLIRLQHKFILYTHLKMTSKVLAAAILHGKVLVFFIRSNNKGINLVCIVSGLMQLARHENFSKQSAWSLQFLE